jgi:hypothetical protein
LAYTAQLSKKTLLTFTMSRYATYGVLLVRGIVVASCLGPHLFGILSLLTLIQTYLSYSSLGIQYAINVELATESASNPEESKKRIGAALGSTMIIAGVVVLIGVGGQFGNISFLRQYSVNRYAIILSVCVGFTHIQQVLANIYRVHGKLLRIGITELMAAGLPLMAVIFFRGEQLIMAVLVSMMLSGILCVLVYALRTPLTLSCSIDFPCARRLVFLGVPLLIYAISIYLLTLSGRTITGIYYPIDTMGHYSFASSISSASMLGLSSIAWVIFPDVLSRTKDGEPDDRVREIVERVNQLYSTSAFVIVFAVLLICPVIFRMMPQYEAARVLFDILIMSEGVLCIAFGYNCVAIARKKQLKVACVALISVAIATILGLCVAVKGMNIVWIPVAVLGGAFTFVLFQAYVGLGLINAGKQHVHWIRTILPWSTMVAAVVFVAGSMLGYRELGWVAGVSIFAGGNRDALWKVYSLIRESAKRGVASNKAAPQDERPAPGVG